VSTGSNSVLIEVADTKGINIKEIWIFHIYILWLNSLILSLMYKSMCFLVELLCPEEEQWFLAIVENLFEVMLPPNQEGVD
jgi:hypothetical protein